MIGFSPQWCFVQGGIFGIRVNEHIGHYHQAKNGLRQCDLLSSVLFNIVVDMLAVLIARGKRGWPDGWSHPTSS
jgi:phage gp46-like protein